MAEAATPALDKLKRLAERFMEDSKTLFDAGRWDGSYYLAGYALEMALKATVCRHLHAAAYPRDDYFKTHDWARLQLLSGTTAIIDSDPALKVNWSTATRWTPSLRYSGNTATTRAQARDMLDALDEPRKGLLPWLRTLW